MKACHVTRRPHASRKQRFWNFTMLSEATSQVSSHFAVLSEAAAPAPASAACVILAGSACIASKHQCMLACVHAQHSIYKYIRSRLLKHIAQAAPQAHFQFFAPAQAMQQS